MLVICFGLVSCSELHSPHYVGEIIEISEEDLGDESTWLIDELVYTIRRTGSNSFVAATMTWDRKKAEYIARTMPILLTALEDDYIFLNLMDEEGQYLILRAVCSMDESLVLFTIDKEKMEKDIKSGKLKARIDEEQVYLECSKEEQDEYILNSIATLFHYDNARIARKVYEDE